MLKAIHAQEDRGSAEEKVRVVVEKLEGMRLSRAAQIVREGACETLSYYAFPREHWRSLRTNNPLERILREVRRRTRVVGNFPDGRSAMMLVALRDCAMWQAPVGGYGAIWTWTGCARRSRRKSELRR